MIDKVNSEAEFFISDKKIKLEDEDGNYIFWVAFINSENEENERSIRTMYGFTELLPGQITADTLISSDGNSYMDFLLNKFKIGNKKSSLDWNVSKDEQLSIKNANFEISNSEGEAVAKIDGETGTVEFGKGSSIFENDGSARMANNNLYWDKNGNITMLGNFQGEVSSTDLEGNKIVINAMNKSIRLYTSENDLMGYISYSTESNKISDWKLWEARMSLRMYERLNGTKWKSTELILSPIGIRHFKYNPDGSIADSASWPQ